MNRHEYTYKEFCDLMQNNDKTFFVKTDTGEYAKVNEVFTKNTDMLYITFENGYVLECAENHSFMDVDGRPLFAVDLKVGSKVKTIYGILLVSDIQKSENDTAYDISINDPHWYVNDENGIIHHNSNICLTGVGAYMKKHKEATCIFYDSEGGVTPTYLKAMGVDPDRVLHVPIKNIEQLKFEMMNHLESLNRGDDVIVFVDSIGNLASKKEAEDAKDNKSAADMTRAKEIKSFFRVVTPYFQHLDIPGVIVAHTYDTMEMFSKKVVSGGQGVMLSADTVIIVGRQQDKDKTTKEIKGWDFILNIEKSRFVKEKMKVPLVVKYDKGIDIFGGLLDIATDLGFVERPTTQSYQRAFIDEETGERTIEDTKWKKKDIGGKEFWADLVRHKPFRKAIEDHFKLGTESLSDEDSDDIGDVIGD